METSLLQAVHSSPQRCCCKRHRHLRLRTNTECCRGRQVIFYRDLQTVVDRTPSTDLLVLAGDWNAHTGPADENTRHVLGRFALSTRCENGDRLVNFTVANRLLVTNTRFQHPRRHLVTWRSNDGRTSNQFDYTLVRARWASSVLDSRAYRGADTDKAHGSDHTLVRASLRIRPQARKSTKIPKRINVANLKLRAGEQFRLELHNRFSLLQQRSDLQPETEWQALKSATIEAAHTHLGVTLRRYRDWITGESLQQAEKARVVRLTGAANFRDLRRRAIHSIRADRITHWRAFTKETERAAACGNSCKLYQMMKRASRSSKELSETLYSRDAAVIASLSGAAESMEGALWWATQSFNSEMFEAKTGVQQGCSLSPTFFKYAIDCILNRAPPDYAGVEVGRSVRVSDLAYADDIVLVGSNCDDVQAALDRVQAAARGVGMSINASKIKVIPSLLDPINRQPLTLDGVDLQDVQSFVYLGSTIIPSGQGVATKGRIYQTIVRTILLYGCETWPLKAVDLRKLEVFENDCLRYVLRCRRIDRVPTTTLCRHLNLRPLPPVLLQRRLRWFGYTARRPERELIRDVLLPPS